MRQAFWDALVTAAAVAIAGVLTRGATRIRRRPAPEPPAALPRCHCSTCRPGMPRG